ncbi:MAG: Hsp70 family protein [Kofleriaceae bacterium]|nr:Hsp70 family protein [Kofleriaceae bacterium]
MAKNAEIILGIDFGTSYSSAAALINQKIEWVLDRGDSMIPSIVHYPKRGPAIVGVQARSIMPSAPHTTVHSIKRILGKPFDDREVRLLDAGVGYRIEAGQNGLAVLNINRQRFACEQVAATILTYLRELAERRFGRRIGQAVIAVPAEASPAFLLSLRQAAKLAHLKLVQVIPEPIAGALSLGMHGKSCNRRIAVCDFGGGTFDATLIEQQGLEFIPVACHGNSSLGGNDFDLIMAEEIASAIHRRCGYSIQKDIARWQELLIRCESAKRILSREQQARLGMSDAYIEHGKLVNIDLLLDREWVERRWQPLIDKMQAVLARLLDTSNWNPDEIDEVVLIGGTSLIPMVKRAVTEFFQRQSISVNAFANVAVAYGATLQTAGHLTIATQLPSLVLSRPERREVGS